jgi:FAD-dependent urate hydroxylase
MKRGLPAVTQRISHDLFFADFPAHEQRLNGDIAPEFPESLYAPALWRSRSDGDRT